MVYVKARNAGKAAAEKAWPKAIKKADPRLIIAAAERYRDDPNREPRFTAHASTWLNQERWNDAPLPQRGGNRLDQAKSVALKNRKNGRPSAAMAAFAGKTPPAEESRREITS